MIGKIDNPLLAVLSEMLRKRILTLSVRDDLSSIDSIFRCARMRHELIDSGKLSDLSREDLDIITCLCAIDTVNSDPDMKKFVLAVGAAVSTVRTLGQNPAEVHRLAVEPLSNVQETMES